MASWQALAQELSVWQELGRSPELWWRDDDAQKDSGALQRLNQLSLNYQIPLQLAVIPAGVEQSLLSAFESNQRLYGLQHGYSHRNHASADKRKCELGDDRSLNAVLAELLEGRNLLAELLGEAFTAALVPPWNRLTEALPPKLNQIGFIGLSTLGPRVSSPIYGLAQVNVHVDLIDWKNRAFAGEARVLSQFISHLSARRQGIVDPDEATGFMTHHLAHDDDCWAFCQKLFHFLQQYPVAWQSPEKLFSVPRV